MDTAQQLQIVVAEVQAARQQVASLNAQVREIVEVEDREKLLSDLEITLEQMKKAVAGMSEREAELVSTYEKLKQSLEG